MSAVPTRFRVSDFRGSSGFVASTCIALTSLLAASSAGRDGNLLSNADFNQDVSGWVITRSPGEGPPAWNPRDSAGKRVSGAAEVGSGGLSQCVTTLPPLRYYEFGGCISPADDGGAVDPEFVTLEFFPNEGCDGQQIGSLVARVRGEKGDAEEGTWHEVQGGAVAPYDSKSARFRVRCARSDTELGGKAKRCLFDAVFVREQHALRRDRISGREVDAVHQGDTLGDVVARLGIPRNVFLDERGTGLTYWMEETLLQRDGSPASPFLGGQASFRFDRKGVLLRKDRFAE